VLVADYTYKTKESRITKRNSLLSVFKLFLELWQPCNLSDHLINHTGDKKDCSGSGECAEQRVPWPPSWRFEKTRNLSAWYEKRPGTRTMSSYQT
jgi:hypothetical protein